jgi:hypothetical protein
MRALSAFIVGITLLCSSTADAKKARRAKMIKPPAPRSQSQLLYDKAEAQIAELRTAKELPVETDDYEFVGQQAKDFETPPGLKK